MHELLQVSKRQRHICTAALNAALNSTFHHGSLPTTGNLPVQRETARNSETHLCRNTSRSSRRDRRACRSRCTCSARTCRRARGTSPSSRVRSNPVRRRRDTYIPAWRSPSRPSPPSTRSARPPTAASSVAAPSRAGFLWAIKGVNCHSQFTLMSDNRQFTVLRRGRDGTLPAGYPRAHLRICQTCPSLTQAIS